MSKTVKVTYNADTLETTIVVDGKEFDTSRIDGKEIADWAYPFMVRKMRWDGFYDEMVTALDGAKAFNLVFEGSEEALDELKEAWEDAPVNIVSGEQGNAVTIIYDADSLTTEITVNGQTFDTTRIKGKEIEDWVYPFMMRKVKWDGIFDELKKVLGTDEYDIQFSGTRSAMKVLMDECPENVIISYQKINKTKLSNEVSINPKQSESDVHWGGLGGSNTNTDRISTEYPSTHKVTQNTVEQNSLVLGEDAEKVYQEGEEYYKQQDYEKAVSAFKKAVNQNYPKAYFYLGECYYYGYGVKRNKASAFELYQNGAKLGEDNSIASLGIYYYYGIGIENNDIRAAELFKESAALNNALGQYYYGRCLYRGEGTEVDYNQAFRYFSLAAEQGITGAQYMLGVCYQYGDGIEKSEYIATTWYKKAASKGDKFAQDLLGDCYYCGIGVSQSYREAVKWYKLSAEQGDVNGQFDLATCYYLGHGTEKSIRDAYLWYGKAAKKGHAGAYRMLGQIWASEDAYDAYVEPDIEVAITYLEKAIDIDPQDEEANYLLGLCYTKIGKQEEGINYLQLAVDNGSEMARRLLSDKQLRRKIYNSVDGVLDLVGMIPAPQVQVAVGVLKTIKSITDCFVVSESEEE